jgi:hypothetical protein
MRVERGERREERGEMKIENLIHCSLLTTHLILYNFIT